MKTSTISTLVLLTASLFGEEVVKPQCPTSVTSLIDVRHRESGGVGYSQGYTTLDYLLTAQGEKWEVLFNLRGHLFNNAQGAGNAGLGMRFPIYGEKYLVGANLYYDCRQSRRLFTNQVGAGLEWLGKYVDFRINGYVPVGQQRSLETKSFDRFSGSSLFVRQHLKGALPSIDGEIGTPLPKHFYFAAGSYYLFEQEKEGMHLGNAWGARVRGEVNFGKYVTLGATVTYDKIFHTRLQGILSINIPLGKWKSTKSREERCLRQVTIMRNEIIPIETKRRVAPLNSSDSSDSLRFIFVNNTAHLPGNGTIETPFSSLKEAEAHSQAGDVIYVFPGDGTPKNMDTGIVLKEDQVIASSGGPLEIEGVIIPPQTPGQNPVITNTNPDEPVITNPGNSDLYHFMILAPWDYFWGIWGHDTVDDLSDTSSMGSYEDVSPVADPHADPDLEDWDVLGDNG